MRQIVDFAPLPTFDDPVPQMVEQLPDITSSPHSHLFPSRLSKCPRSCLRTSPCERLFGSCSWRNSCIEVIGQPVEQIVDSPVPRGRLPGLQGFLPGHSYSLTAEQIVDHPVPRPGGGGGLQGLHRGLSSTAFSEQIAEFPDPGGVFKIFSQSRVPQRLLQLLLDTLIIFFALILTGKKGARIPLTQGSEVRVVEHMDAMSLAGVWCRWLRHWRQHDLHGAQHGVRRLCREARVALNGMLLWFTLLPSGLEQPLVQAVRGCRALSAYSPRICQSLFWCMGVACGVQRIGFFGRVRYMVQQWIHVLREALDDFFHIFYVAVNSNPEAFCLHSRTMESVHSRCFWL